MLGDAPVVLNCPSFSRLPELLCAKAVTTVAVAKSAAADAASIVRLGMKHLPCAEVFVARLPAIMTYRENPASAHQPNRGNDRLSGAIAQPCDAAI